MVACWNLMSGDCRDLLRQLKARGIKFDSCVTDPPYHLTSITKRFAATSLDDDTHTSDRSRKGADGYARLAKGFMGKVWDDGDTAFQPETWKAVYDVLKPGAYLAAFGGCRSHHRMWCAIEDAGFTIVDTLMWMFGSGMPKSHNVGLAIDKKQGAIRGTYRQTRPRPVLRNSDEALSKGSSWFKNTEWDTPDKHPITDDAKQWHGFGTGLKPSYEILALAQRPLELHDLCKSITTSVMRTICKLPSYVRGVGRNSQLRSHVFVEGFGSAQWTAVVRCSTSDDLFDLMDTLPSMSTIPTCLSIALSWLSILAEVLVHANKFTIEMALGMTTDLKILNSLISQITPESIIVATTSQHGTGSIASTVDKLFHVVSTKLSIIQDVVAAENAIERSAVSSPVKVGRLSPSNEPIILAIKPREGTIVQNVLKHGVGVMQISGCKIVSRTTDIFLHRAGYTLACAERTFADNTSYIYQMHNDIHHVRTWGRLISNVASSLRVSEHDNLNDHHDQPLGDLADCYPIYRHLCDVLARACSMGDQSMSRQPGYVRRHNHFATPLDVQDEVQAGILHEYVNLLSSLDFSILSGHEAHKVILRLRRIVVQYLVSWQKMLDRFGLIKSSRLQPDIVAQFLVPSFDQIDTEVCRMGAGSASELLLFNISVIPYLTTNTLPLLLQKLQDTGRWPANLLHDGSDEVEDAFGLFGERGCGVDNVSRYFKSCQFTKEELRFIYTSKAGDDDRAWSRHTTVKPLELMHWLVRLVTPPGGTVLDCFAGSGTTLQAAVEQGFNAVGCEITQEYITDIERRMATFCAWYPRRDPFMPLPRRTMPVAAVKPVRRPMPRRV